MAFNEFMELLIMRMFLPIFIAYVSSTGYWKYKESKNKKQDDMADMMMGLGHDKIMNLGQKYLEKGFITHDEYENLYEYIYRPYSNLGGNGSANRIMEQVAKLPSTPGGARKE